MAGYNDLKTKAPDLASQWDYEKNAGLLPEAVTLNYGKKVWWICPEGHSYEAKPANRNHGTGCPYCAGRKVLEGFNDLKSRDPKVAAQWDYEKNGDLRPEMVTQFSKHKVWWKCKKGHSWYGHISNRTLHKHGCPYCAGQRAIAGENDLATLDPVLASEWDYDKNGELRPDNVMPGSQKKVWWKCTEGHSWRAAVYSRKDNGCPVCSGRQVIPGVNDLKTIMPEIAKEWDYEKNGNLQPEDVTAQSNKVIWWRCEKNHSWKAKPCERYRGNGCPKCDGRIKMRTYFM